MNYKTILLLLVVMGLAISAQATEGDKPAEETQKTTQPAPVVTTTTETTPTNEIAVRKPIYKPPLRGAPAGRVGGGTRGATERESFVLMVLAPDHLGYTIREQPCLYWYISKATPHRVEVTLTERYAVQPIIEKTIVGPETGGVQQICLADYNVQLRDEVPYKWFVTLVTDAEQRSKDILAGGMLAKLSASETLRNRLNGSEPFPNYFVYAEEGLWYDAVDAMYGQTQKSPEDENLRQHFAALLEQVGLGELMVFGSNPAQ